MISIKLISTIEELNEAFRIRKEVFVNEQKVPEDMELDEFEQGSVHFLAFNNLKQPVGTSRWRFTENGVKLERFAVIQSARGKGVGAALLNAVLKDVFRNPNFTGQNIYLNAQIAAVGFYQRLGFGTTGSPFDECGIQHLKMIFSPEKLRK
jgi:predicted GNAT family N-acyltransferase